LDGEIIPNHHPFRENKLPLKQKSCKPHIWVTG
jgi:hypothetical protein